MTQRTQGGKTTTFKYTAFNMPSAITASGGDYSNFEYDHARARMIQTANTGTTFYLNMSPTGGTLYEKEHRPVAGVTMHRHYLGNMIGAYVIEEYSTSRQVNRQYYLKDHLGSIDVVMNHFGDGVTNSENLSFDPFGKRRLATDWKESSDIVASNTSRGFTGHEHLDELGLIHMNGRVYDPQVARFTSADPNIDGATSVQGFNRYTYVHNNPLSAADPTGFFKWSKFRDKWVKPIAAIAISAASGGSLAGVMFSGFMSGLIMSGGDIKSAFVGAFTAALFFGVGDFFQVLAKGGSLSAPQFAAKVLAHGAVGGVSSKLQGGEFRDGFRAAAFTQAFAPLIDKVPGSDFGAKATRVTIAAIVGGTASELGGGKFENGAMTGAFSRAFNEELHPGKKGLEKFKDDYADIIKSGNIDVDGNIKYAKGASLSEFIDKVETRGDWDYKNNDKLVKEFGSGRMDEFGNAHFGVVAAARDYSLSLTLAGAGGYQTFVQGRGNLVDFEIGYSLLVGGVPESTARAWTNGGLTWGDKPGDSLNIMRGWDAYHGN